MARPRSIRSLPTAGVGGRRFTDAEAEAIYEAGERYAFDVDRDALLECIWSAFGSYQSGDDALRKQVGLADEKRDLEAITADSATVRSLLVNRVDEVDPHSCIAPAHLLGQRIANFPNMYAAATTAKPHGVEFMHAQIRLSRLLVRVRYWPENRSQLVADIDLILKTCATVETPAGFTKRYNTARDRFERDLAEIYRELLHPDRLRDWVDSRDDRDDPPPPISGRAFARKVMEILGVPFEVKRRKG